MAKRRAATTQSQDSADASPTLSPRWRRRAVLAMEAALVVALFALMLRVRLVPLERMVTGDAVFFIGTDPYYHLRHVMVALHNFPHLLAYDPWTYFPRGTASGQFGTLFDLILAGALLVVGGGSPPDARTVQVAAAAYPAVLGALTVVPVYLTARVAYGRVGAAWAAVVVALVSGEFLVRSLGGYFDHHVAEALFSTAAVGALLFALHRAGRSPLDLARPRDLDARAVASPLAWGAVAGVALALYVLVWNYGVLFVAIFDIFFLAHFVVAHLRDDATDGVALAGVAAFLVAGLLLVPAGLGEGLNLHRYSLLQPLLLVVSALGVATLQALRVVVAERGWPAWAFPAAVAAAVVVGALATRVLVPDLWRAALTGLGWVTGTGSADQLRTIAEAREMEWSEMKGQQGYLYLPALVGLGVAGWRAWRTGRPAYALLVVWGVVTFVAALNQVRFNYYWTVAMALLNGLLVAEVARVTGLTDRLARMAEGRPSPDAASGGHRGKGGRGRGRKRGRHGGGSRGAWGPAAQAGAVALVALFILPGLVLPTSGAPSTPWEVAERVGPGEEGLWVPELQWMRDNTPPVPGFTLTAHHDGPIQYPPGAYGVLSWWDYGHWIQTVGERPPVANPFQQAAPFASEYFTAPAPEAETLLREWEGDTNVRYVMIDSAMATGKFSAITVWAKAYGQMFPTRTNDPDAVESVRFPGDEEIDLPVMRPPFWESQLARLYFDDANGLPNYRLVREAPSLSYVGSVVAVQGERMNLQCLHASFPAPRCPFAPTAPTGEVLDRSARGEAVPVRLARGGGDVTAYAYDVRIASNLKTFERVEGAVLTGEAAPGATVTARVGVASEAGRSFVYTREATVDEGGRFNLTVAYASGSAEEAAGRTVNATGPYVVDVTPPGGGPGRSAQVDVPDAAVLRGHAVTVAFEG